MKQVNELAEADVKEWNEIATKLNAEQPAEDKLMKQAVSVPEALFKQLQRQLRNKSSMRFKFTCDEFYSVIKRKDDTLWVYDPEHPDGRELMTLQGVKEAMDCVIVSMKGFLVMKGIKAGMSENDASNLGLRYGSKDKFLEGLLLLQLFKLGGGDVKVV